MMGYLPVLSDMASWKIPELNGGLMGKSPIVSMKYPPVIKHGVLEITLFIGEVSEQETSIARGFSSYPPVIKHGWRWKIPEMNGGF